MAAIITSLCLAGATFEFFSAWQPDVITYTLVAICLHFKVQILSRNEEESACFCLFV